MSDRIESRVEIIQAGDSGATIVVWVKNVGSSFIDDVPRSDVFYGPEDDFSRITYGGVGTPRWDYVLEGGFTRWDQGVTCKITITLTGAPTAGTYLLKYVIPNGIYDSTTFAVD